VGIDLELGIRLGLGLGSANFQGQFGDSIFRISILARWRYGWKIAWM